MNLDTVLYLSQNMTQNGYRPKCKTQNYRSLYRSKYKRLHSRNPNDLAYKNGNFLDITPKTWSTKEKCSKKNFIKIKNFCCAKDIFKENKNKSHRLGKKNICQKST